MKIHCICVLRDEADVVRHTLDAATGWAHAIYVLDNGSTDGTWELLQEYAARSPQVVLVGREFGHFRNALRGRVANAVRASASEGDWWCRLDADEIYVDDPRALLARVGSRYQIVNSLSIDYLFTDEDLVAYEADPGAYTERWEPGRQRHYLAYWSEPRFIRHFPSREWVGAWPSGWKSMRVAPERVRIRHYQYRSPPQIDRRLGTRVSNTEAGAFPHEKAPVWNPTGRLSDLLFRGGGVGGEPWRTRVVRASALHRDTGEDDYRIEWDRLPPLRVGRPLAQRVVERVRRLFAGGARR